MHYQLITVEKIGGKGSCCGRSVIEKPTKDIEGIYNLMR